MCVVMLVMKWKCAELEHVKENASNKLDGETHVFKEKYIDQAIWRIREYLCVKTPLGEVCTSQLRAACDLQRLSLSVCTVVHIRRLPSNIPTRRKMYPLYFYSCRDIGSFEYVSIIN
jgi:hypothetical protein